MMKKICMLLCLCLAFSFTGCGGSEEEAQTNEPKEEAAEEKEGKEDKGDKEEPKEEKAEPETEYESITVDNAADVQLTMDYPKGMTFEELPYTDVLGQKLIKSSGILKGEEYEITFAFAELYSDYYASVEDYCTQLKSFSDIYEEADVSGMKVWICQAQDTSISVVIPCGDRQFAAVEFTIPDATETAHYQDLYESDEFRHMVESITMATGEVEQEMIDVDGFCTVTPNSGWYKKVEEDGSWFLKNDGLQNYSVIKFAPHIEKSLIDLENATGVIHGQTGAAADPEVKTIGTVEFTIITAEEDRIILLAENANKELLQVSVTGCTLEDALPVLETIVIK